METSTSPTPQKPRAARGSWMPIALVALFVLVISGPALRPRANWMAYEPQSGDILFQSLPRNELVNCIEGSTGSPWSHCGIVAQEEGQWYVYEAIGDVHRTPLNEFYGRGRDGRFAVCRLRADHRAEIPQLIEKTKEYVGRPYDMRYQMDDEAIYCSELIFKAYRSVSGKNLGKTVKLGELKWQPYRAIIEHLEGGPAPLDREMITPRDLAEAEQLEFVTGYDAPQQATRN